MVIDHLSKSSWCRLLTYVALVIMLGISFVGSNTTQHMLLVSAMMSAIWVVWYGYDYRTADQILIGGRFNVMTWIIWTLSLVLMAAFYMFLKRSGWPLGQRVWITGFLWLVSITIIEWLGYNVFKIQLKSNYPGLLGLNLMHGPQYLKFYYLTAWVIFLTFLNAW